MTSPSSWSVALRHTSSQAVRQYRPLSVQFQSVRWASIVPYSVNEHSFYSPPPPPMTLEQIQQHVQRKQQLLLEEQVQLEQRQRMRQQQELQIQLAKHRNAILEQQQQQQQEMQNELAEYRKSILKQKQEQEQQQQKQQQQQQQELAQVRHDQQVHAEGGEVEKAQVEHETRAQETSSSSTPLPETDASRQQFIPTWRRTMFGYRGPEQVIMGVNTAATGDSTAATLLEMEQESILKNASRRRSISTMITAENRVRLTLLDYTPKQIDAMTPIQADAILSSKEQQDGNQQKQKQEQQEQSALKSEAAAAATSRKLLSVKELNDNKGEYHSVHTITSFVSAPVGSVNMDVQVKGSEQQHQQDRFALRVVSDVMAPISTPSSRVLASSQRNHEGHVTSSSPTRRPTGDSSSSPSTL